MMRHFFLFIMLISGVSFTAYSQTKVELSGTIVNKETNETIIGAKIVVNNQQVKSDIDGKYSILLESNKLYELRITFLGFDTLILKVQLGNSALQKNIYLKPYETLIDEVTVTGDMAKTRETPIAFSKLSSKQIAEDLGTRDLPMILNSTPGAYATEQGGGAGDARVSIRGFDQRNIAVLVDGVPVNDMENGQVYWSNWDGLGDITKYMQVQRGLGASKLSIVSVGGTMNIVTKGIDQKMGAYVKQEVNDYGLYKTSIGYNSGMLKGNWGITVAGARKWGSSYADATFDDAWSYFFKVQKKMNRHLISFGVNGAPQSHGQRLTRLPIAVIDKRLTENLGIDYLKSLDSISKLSNSQFTTPTIGARGIRYNPNYGIMNEVEFNEKVNYFHKPQFNLTHSYNLNEKININTVLYMSIGKGGGTSMKNQTSRDTTTGLINMQDVYNYNSTHFSNLYSTTQHVSSNYIRSANNDHKWIGLLSTLNYKINNKWSAMFGIDARYYKGSHYQSIYDLMGGDYAIDNANENQPTPSPGNTSYSMKKVGDKVSYYNDAFVKWGGVFGQIEYKKDKWSAFLTSSVNRTSYQRVDYYKKKDIVLTDTIFVQAVGYGDTLNYNGSEYTINSSEARFATTEEKWFTGATIKTGANYNIDKNHNVFFNTGYLNIAPKMNTVFDNNNREFLEIKNQKVYSFELGYGYKHKKFSANVNGYYTLWRNKPPQTTYTTLDGDSYNINGLDALHKGIELDFIYKILSNLDFEGLVSIGDWRTISGSLVTIYDQDNNKVGEVDFSAKDVHVGDAAQIQLGSSLRYEIIKNLYVKLRFTYFDKNYANFDPVGLVGNNKDRESWKMPSYSLLDLNFGYDIKFLNKYKATLSGGVMNLLNSVYITDAQNGVNFDAATATVFVGMGRRFNVGLKMAF
jgi:iron complex outermembrane receptor protein